MVAMATARAAGMAVMVVAVLLACGRNAPKGWCLRLEEDGDREAVKGGPCGHCCRDSGAV